MRSNSSVLITLLSIQCFAILCASQDFDFYYFVQQWPGSYCDSRRGCCYPKTGKPAEDFSIHGLWPNYADGSYPSNCDRANAFHQFEVSDLKSVLEKEWPSLSCPSSDDLRFWQHEWEKHGTCAESLLDEHAYFKAALDLKSKANLLQVLTNAGIKPSEEKMYRLESIKKAIKDGIGYDAYVECNVDASRNHQLYQVYLCVDTSASKFIQCPVLPRGAGCGSHIQFPTFSSSATSTLHEEL